MLSGAFKTIADAWENIKESGVLDAAMEPRVRRRKQERARAKIIEQRYRAEIRRAENTRIYRRIYKPVSYTHLDVYKRQVLTGTLVVFGYPV